MQAWLQINASRPLALLSDTQDIHPDLVLLSHISTPTKMRMISSLISGSPTSLNLKKKKKRLSLVLPFHLDFPHLFFFFWLFAFYWATLAAHGGSQARGRIGAVATSLHHSSQQRRILNPLSKARDGTHNLMVPRRIR